MLLAIVSVALFVLMIPVTIKAVNARQDGVVWTFKRVTDAPAKAHKVTAWKVWATVLALLFAAYLVVTYIDAL